MEFRFVNKENESLAQAANFYIGEEERLRREATNREQQYLYTAVMAEEREKANSNDAPQARARLEQLEAEHATLVTEYDAIKPKADKAQEWLKQQQTTTTAEATESAENLVPQDIPKRSTRKPR